MEVATALIALSQIEIDVTFPHTMRRWKIGIFFTAMVFFIIRTTVNHPTEKKIEKDGHKKL